MEEKENIKDLETEKEEKVETEEVVEEKKDAETETDTENKEEVEEEVKEEEQPKVVEQEFEEKGNGIPLEEIVTKEYLMEQLNSLNAKFDAVLKENKDLKEKLDDSNGKVKAMQEKYEEDDFGNATKKGVPTTKEQGKYQSFDEYASYFGK